MKAYNCEICGESFDCYDELTDHLNNEHDVNITASDIFESFLRPDSIFF
jgi:hypothetical protein